MRPVRAVLNVLWVVAALQKGNGLFGLLVAFLVVVLAFVVFAGLIMLLR